VGFSDNGGPLQATFRKRRFLRNGGSQRRLSTTDIVAPGAILKSGKRMKGSDSMRMLRVAVTAILVFIAASPCCHAASTLSGSVQDRANGPVDGASVTVWIPGGDKHVQTTSAGRYSFIEIEKGDYLVKVEKPGMGSLYGAVRLTDGDHHEFNLVLAKNPGLEPIVKAESPYDLPAQGSRISKSDREVKRARLLRQVAPEYPVSAKIPGMGVRVQIAGLIRTNGTFDNIVVLSSPSPDLALATLSAVRQWRYSPTYVKGEPVEVMTVTDVRFHPR
jgi:hypothetical protein